MKDATSTNQINFSEFNSNFKDENTSNFEFHYHSCGAFKNTIENDPIYNEKVKEDITQVYV